MNPRMNKLSVALYHALGTGVALSLAATGAQAQAPAQKIDKIEVTGSNIKRIEGEGALLQAVVEALVHRLQLRTLGRPVVQRGLQGGGDLRHLHGAGEVAGDDDQHAVTALVE